MLHIHETALTDIQKKRQNADSLLAVHRLFPGRTSTISLWIAYENLYEKALRSRLVNGDLSWYTRRVLVRQIIALKKQFTLTLDDPRKVEVFLDSLILISMDVLPKITNPVVEFPLVDFPLKPLTKVAVVPSNESGSSCFCDVVIVAMFLATDRYDILLTDTNPFQFFWADKFSETEIALIPWIINLISFIGKSPCYFVQLEQLTKGSEPRSNIIEDSERAKELTKQKLKQMAILLREHIVKPMRGYEKTTESNDIGKSISNLRTKITDECGRLKSSIGEFRQDDASEFFRTLLEIGGWQSIFLPVLRHVRTDTFSESGVPRTLDKVRGVKPWIRTTIEAPGIIQFSIHDDSIQTAIDHFFFEADENVDKDIESGTFFEHVLLQDPNLIGTISSINVDTSIEKQLFRLSDPLVFTLKRVVPTRFNPKGERIFTRVSIPPDDQIKFPIMESHTDKQSAIPYRIYAIVCHSGATALSGHYVLYFRYGNRWYFYDDAFPVKFEEVSIHDDPKKKKEDHRGFVQRNAYLFWAERVRT